MTPKYINALSKETSPYLLQHANNPVDWVAWNPESLARAERENKLLLVSIGYAACHWCHVMEHECFEDAEVAKTMNRYFINIKVDREERPDVDHIYMDALQMMTGSGGWPLNIVALPDGRPFWGATFVKKNNWIQVLEQLAELYREDPAKVEGYAKNMAEGLVAINLVEGSGTSTLLKADQLDQAVTNWSRHFDTEMGGYARAPKFMMPVNLNFLLHYATDRGDDKLLKYVETTLTKMAWGGVFDPIGGGFSRYSVDTRWHVPHFEKMLYDNAQLASLYAQAYAATGNKLYRRTVEKTIAFVQNELMSDSYGFFSSLDADSLTGGGILEEGAYYVWQEAELKELLKERYPLFKDYFNINDFGYWEDGNYVLIRNASAEEVAKENNLSVPELERLIEEALQVLQEARAERNRPRLDDKILTSWNGLMLKGLTDAYRYLKEDAYLDLALKNADFILKNLYRPKGGLYHNHKNGKSTITGFLEDYAAVISGFIGLYEVTFDEKWLDRAKRLTQYCQDHFYDERSGMFYFTSNTEASLVRRTMEVNDNVIPASNSIMANNLFILSKYFPSSHYEELAGRMLKNVQNNFLENGYNHAHWMQLALRFQRPFYEAAVVGEAFKDLAKQIGSKYLPNSILAGSPKDGTIPLLKKRFVPEKTLVYVCQSGNCSLPTENLEEALERLGTFPLA